MQSLVVIFGPMFAGKSTKLIELASEHSAEKHLVFKHQRDQARSADMLSSHEKELHGRVPARPINSLWQIIEYIEPDTKWVFVDETQFFDGAEMVFFVERFQEKFANVNFVFAGLDLKFTGEPWEAMRYLIGKATETYQIWSTCARCNQAATHTHLKGEVESIGGAELYEPRCKPCHDLAKHRLA